MILEEKVDVVILGCTELPLILKQEDESRVVLLNTTEIHFQSIVQRLE